MARQALVLDASVGVKWFSQRGEDSLAQALAIRDSHVAGEVQVGVPDLFYYEVTNALVYKKNIPIEAIRSVIRDLFNLSLDAFPAGIELLAASTTLARQFDITVYDACYAALAREHGCPLVTANPRHQRPDLGCEVIRIQDWPLRPR